MLHHLEKKKIFRFHELSYRKLFVQVCRRRIGRKSEAVSGVVLSNLLEITRHGEARPYNLRDNDTLLPQLDDNDVKLCEYLMKRGRTNVSWKRRLFVLSTHTLEYYRDPKDLAPGGVIHLRCVVLYTCTLSKTHTHAQNTPTGTR
jgi:hypothetical protein